MFAYCGNNPIIRCDNNGEFWNFIIGAIGGAVGGKGATDGNKYMSRQYTRLGKHIVSDGAKNIWILQKMTNKYSKQFIKGTI